MYSLYKQATVGNVKSPRPGIWDMLGRAKWDAWAKHKDLDSYEAKWLYVDAMLKVLRKYSDKTVAKDLVQELESFGGDPANLVISRELSQSRSSHSSSSTESEQHTSRLHYQPRPLATGFPSDPDTPHRPEDDPDTNSEGAADDAANEHTAQSLYTRPQSSLSSHRYRTPMAGSMISTQPMALPSTQQPSGFETPSAFAEPRSASHPPAVYPPGFYTEHYAKLVLSSPTYPASSGFRDQPLQVPERPFGSPIRPASRPTLERAIENVQAHLAALNERLESLESMSAHPHRSTVSLPTRSSSPRFRGGLGSPADRGDYEWDLDDLGMWSLILSPVTRVGAALRQLAKFFATSEHSPTLIVVRRLCLDVSFLFCVLWVVRSLWRKTGMRRREVKLALKILGRAIMGKQQERSLVNRGV